MKVVSERSQAEIDAHQAVEEVGWRMRELAANLDYINSVLQDGALRASSRDLRFPDGRRMDFGGSGSAGDASGVRGQARSFMGGFTDPGAVDLQRFTRLVQEGRAIVPTDRQLSDKMIRAIVSRGGVIGINGVSLFLGENDTTSDAPTRRRDLPLFGERDFHVEAVATVDAGHRDPGVRHRPAQAPGHRRLAGPAGDAGRRSGNAR